jgi:hypothetical protein
VSEDAGIEPRTLATLALVVSQTLYNPSVGSHLFYIRWLTADLAFLKRKTFIPNILLAKITISPCADGLCI